MKIDKRLFITISVALFGVSGFFVTSPAWPGSPATYGLLTAAFTVLLIAGVIRQSDVGYLLLVAVLWIGFWLKLCLHIIDKTTAWMEPTGRFDFSQTAWDEVALVSTVGALAVLCVGLLWRGRVDRCELLESVDSYTPSMRAFLWTMVLAITGLVVACNEIFHIFHAGLRPALDMPWPLQGLFGWLVSVGLILVVMVVYYLDVLSGRPLWLATVLFMVVSTALAITTSSRGTFVLQSMPLLATLILLRTHIPWLNRWRLLAIAGMLMCGMIFTVAASQQRRANVLHEYDTKIVVTPAMPAIPTPAPAPATPAIPAPATPAIPAPATPAIPAPAIPAYRIARYNLLQDFTHLMRRLAIDRWVGLEGVMAVSAYPAKGYDLLIRAAKERRDKDHVDIYTGEVSQSGFQDTSNYQFATLPGMFAFWYYSGSLIVVFIGTVFISAAVLAVERAICQTTHNPFLAGQVGMYAATLAVQMGAGGLAQPASTLLFTVAIAFILGFFVRYLNLSFTKYSV